MLGKWKRDFVDPQYRIVETVTDHRSIPGVCVSFLPGVCFRTSVPRPSVGRILGRLLSKLLNSSDLRSSPFLVSQIGHPSSLTPLTDLVQDNVRPSDTVLWIFTSDANFPDRGPFVYSVGGLYLFTSLVLPFYKRGFF